MHKCVNAEGNYFEGNTVKRRTDSASTMIYWTSLVFCAAPRIDTDRQCYKIHAYPSSSKLASFHLCLRVKRVISDLMCQRKTKQIKIPFEEVFPCLLMFGKWKFSLQEALDLLQHLPSEIKELRTDDFPHEEVPVNKLNNTARGGRVRSTTPAEDRYIVLSAKRNRRTTAQQVANQFLAASGKQISRKTVARRLRGGGLYARRPVVCVPLTRQHRTARLQWCREHHNWTEQDWACVLFSDESRFSLSSDCRRQLIWHESGTAYRPENIQDRYPTCSIMVWAGIMTRAPTCGCEWNYDGPTIH
ncbi:hypothetical protein TNCV_976091 [Trichonephila clavipes]|nr:hypothetical protein TNCV_976091 [Trichonephila clavipes]